LAFANVEITDNADRYGKFFAEDLSADCNNVTWTTWIYVSTYI